MSSFTCRSRRGDIRGQCCTDTPCTIQAEHLLRYLGFSSNLKWLNRTEIIEIIFFCESFKYHTACFFFHTNISGMNHFKCIVSPL